MKDYRVTEKYFSLDCNVKMPHSAGAAMKEAIEEINALHGEITFCHVTDPDPYMGIVQIIYSVEAVEA